MSSDDDTASLENGHLQELEVDLSLVILEEGLEDYDADHSPFPEGTSCILYRMREDQITNVIQSAPLSQK